MPRILHFGVGNFHRAHQAWYTAAANLLGTGEQWIITGASLRHTEMRDALASQEFRYTLVTKDSGDTQYQEIKVHDDILLGGKDQQAILATIADPDTQVITVTVSEKGYYTDPASQQLLIDDPVIAAELSEQSPASVIGFLAYGLTLRQTNNAGPITVLSCDNLSANGQCLERAVRAFAQAAGLDPVAESSVSFADTMVDRITPATTDELRREVHGHCAAGDASFKDASPVSTEPFSEWIIERRFAAALPAWDKVGAQYVDEVMPYELRKLRLLNGAHSYLAYAGLLHGHEYVHQAVADPVLRAGVDGIMQEAITTLSSAVQAEAPDYCRALIKRFSNSSLHHELIQIASDGSQKLPVRLLRVIKDRQTMGLESPHGRDAVLKWLAFVGTQVIRGVPLNDPLGSRIYDIFRNNSDNRIQCESLLKEIESNTDVVSYCLDGL